MNEDRYELLFNDFLLSCLNKDNAALIKELSIRWKEYLGTPVIKPTKEPEKEFVWTDALVLEFAKFTYVDSPTMQGRYADLQQFKASKTNKPKEDKPKETIS